MVSHALERAGLEEITHWLLSWTSNTKVWISATSCCTKLWNRTAQNSAGPDRNDALLGRFGASKFEVRRPTLDLAVDCMERHCLQLGVVATRDQLTVVARQRGIESDRRGVTLAMTCNVSGEVLCVGPG